MFQYEENRLFSQHHKRIQNLHNPSEDRENWLEHSWKGYLLTYHLPPDKDMPAYGKPHRPQYKQCSKYDWPMALISFASLAGIKLYISFLI